MIAHPARPDAPITRACWSLAGRLDVDIVCHVMDLRGENAKSMTQTSSQVTKHSKCVPKGPLTSNFNRELTLDYPMTYGLSRPFLDQYPSQAEHTCWVEVSRLYRPIGAIFNEERVASTKLDDFLVW